MSPAPLLGALILAGLLPFQDWSEARRAAAQGEPLTGRVTAEIAEAALTELAEAPPPAELRLCARLARARREAHPRLALTLFHLARERSGPRRGVALAALCELPPRALEDLFRAQDPDPLCRLLLGVLSSPSRGAEDPTERAAFELFGPIAQPSQLEEAVRALRWRTRASEDLTRLLSHVTWALDAPRTYRALARLRLPPGLEEERAGALRRLVAAGASDAALEAAERSDAPSAVIRSLGAVPPARWERASPLVLRALRSGSEPRLGAALDAASELCLPEALELALDLCASETAAAATRSSALEAIRRLGARDHRTLSLLIARLEDADPRVAERAHQVLLTKARARLPARPEAWRRWLRGQALESEEPAAARERLERTRRARIRFSERALRAEPRPER